MAPFIQLFGVGVALFSLAPPPAASFSRGASHASCQDMIPGHIRAHLQEPRHTHVAVRTSASSYLPGQLVTVTVRSSRDFMGFLLQARSDQAVVGGATGGGELGVGTRSGGGHPVLVGGSWALTPPGAHTLQCRSEGDTVTHSDKQLKRNLSFVWRAPGVPAGDVRFRLTVVQSYFVYWANIESAVLHDGSRSWESTMTFPPPEHRVVSLPASPDPQKSTDPSPPVGPRTPFSTDESSQMTVGRLDLGTNRTATSTFLREETSRNLNPGPADPDPQEDEGTDEPNKPGETQTVPRLLEPPEGGTRSEVTATSLNPPKPKPPNPEDLVQNLERLVHPPGTGLTTLQTGSTSVQFHSSDSLTELDRLSQSENTQTDPPQGPGTSVPPRTGPVPFTGSTRALSKATPSPFNPLPVSLRSEPEPGPNLGEEDLKSQTTSSPVASTSSGPSQLDASLVHLISSGSSDPPGPSSLGSTRAPVSPTAPVLPVLPPPPPISTPPHAPPIQPSSSCSSSPSSPSSPSRTSSIFPRSTSPHPGPSPAPRRSLNAPLTSSSSPGNSWKLTAGQRLVNQHHVLISDPSSDLDPTTPRTVAHQNPKPGPNLLLRPELNQIPPNSDTKPKPPSGSPDQEAKYPDLVPRHRDWELGMLLGCSAGLGMFLVVGVRYLYRQACGRRTAVTLNDRQTQHGRGGGRGLIQVQEGGDLVRVRKIRENSFVLLAEYDILAPPGD